MEQHAPIYYLKIKNEVLFDFFQDEFYFLSFWT